MLTTMLLLTLNAPVPLPKAPPPPPKISAEALLGDWDCKWAGTPCIINFRKDGIYGCTWLGEDWFGSWELKGNTLYITEQKYNHNTQLKWTIELVAPHTGRIVYDKGVTDKTFHGPFELHPRGTIILGPGL